MAKRRASTPPPPPPRAGVTTAVTFDRAEPGGAGAELAVLVLDDGRSVVVPRDLLPDAAAPGTSLRLTLSVDREATTATREATANLRADLKKTDPGGTIHL